MDIFSTAEKQMASADKARTAFENATTALQETRARFHRVMGTPSHGGFRIGGPHKVTDRTQWHPWFAWHPVRIDGGTLIWWGWVERREWCWVSGGTWGYAYRLLGTNAG